LAHPPSSTPLGWPTTVCTWALVMDTYSGSRTRECSCHCPAPTFPTTVIGQSSTEPLTITANSAVQITSLTPTGPFTVEAQAFRIPSPKERPSLCRDFYSTTAGPAGGASPSQWYIETATVSLSGSGELAGPSLTSTTGGISFGGIVPIPNPARPWVCQQRFAAIDRLEGRYAGRPFLRLGARPSVRSCSPELRSWST